MVDSDRDSDSERGTKRKYSGSGDAHRASRVHRIRMRVPTPRGGGDDDVTSACASPLESALQREETGTETDEDPDAKERHYAALYRKELDFRALGEQDGDLKALLLQGGDVGTGSQSRLDFSDPRAVMQLTKTLLRLDFGLQIELPSDRLCPPVPNRHNYVLWLKELLDSSAASYAEVYEPARRVRGLDIGTGASLIYPLLACAQRPAWSFIATDVDPKSLDYARRNAERNGLQSRIRVVGQQHDIAAPLVPLDELGVDRLDFAMVNPPFYSSEAELLDLARQKARPPLSACTGAPVEMVYAAGGEVGFVGRIVDESLALRDRVQWYTAMLGKQSSLDVLVSRLRDRGVDNYAITAFVQGNRTRRWALGWSFGNRRPSLKASRGFEPAAGKRILPPPTELVVFEDDASAVDPSGLETLLRNAMAALDLVSWKWDSSASRGVGFADGNVWSRAYRRKKERQPQPPTDGGIEPRIDRSAGKVPADVQDCPFGFAIWIHREHNGTRNAEGRVKVTVRWLQGRDYSLLESFTGMLRQVILRATSVHAADGSVEEASAGNSTTAEVK